jgi:hypothetical protein
MYDIWIAVHDVIINLLLKKTLIKLDDRRKLSLTYYMGLDMSFPFFYGVKLLLGPLNKKI